MFILVVISNTENTDLYTTSNDVGMEYDSYDYCVRMRIDRVKQAAVIELDKQLAEKHSEMEHLESETGRSLWLADLDDLEASWQQYSQIRVAESVSVTSANSKPALRIRKAVAKK